MSERDRETDDNRVSVEKDRNAQRCQVADAAQLIEQWNGVKNNFKPLTPITSAYRQRLGKRSHLPFASDQVSLKRQHSMYEAPTRPARPC